MDQPLETKPQECGAAIESLSHMGNNQRPTALARYAEQGDETGETGLPLASLTG